MSSFRLLLPSGFSVAAVLAPSLCTATSDPHVLFARTFVASGGSAWRTIVADRKTGSVLQGGAPDRMIELADRRTGWSKTFTDLGTLRDVAGFEGVAWDFQGRSVTEQTLPRLRADNVTQAYVSRDR